jgi:thymidylate synthase (FAD)
MEKVDVLDHGFVRLVDSMGSDLSSSEPRASLMTRLGAPARTRAAMHALIRYLWKNHHTTPFEAVTLTFEVKAPIFVLRQWHRHRTWSYNELSARYRELPEEFYVPDPEVVGQQSESSKQARDLGRSHPSVNAHRDPGTANMQFEAYRTLLERASRANSPARCCPSAPTATCSRRSTCST